MKIKSKISFIVGFCTAVFLFHGCTDFDNCSCPTRDDLPVSRAIDSNTALAISEAVCEMQNDYSVYGMQTAIIDSGGDLWRKSFGTSGSEQEDELSNDDVLRIGSVTKIFTSVLIQKMMEEGYFTDKTLVSEFFPEYASSNRITIDNLLRHSSGIRDIFTIPSIFISSSTYPDKQWNPNDLAEQCMDKGLDFTPGEKHSYSNTNYILLGLIAEKAAGEPVADLYRRYIFEAAGLNSTFFVPYGGTPESLISGYVHKFALSLKSPYETVPENTSWATAGYTAGAIASTAEDLVVFMDALFSGKIISENSLQEMISFNGKYGRGIMKIEGNGSVLYGHEGEITGFTAIAAYNPEFKTSIAICSNTTPFDIHALLKKINKILEK